MSPRGVLRRHQQSANRRSPAARAGAQCVGVSQGGGGADQSGRTFPPTALDVGIVPKDAEDRLDPIRRHADVVVEERDDVGADAAIPALRA